MDGLNIELKAIVLGANLFILPLRTGPVTPGTVPDHLPIIDLVRMHFFVPKSNPNWPRQPDSGLSSKIALGAFFPV